VAKAKKSMVRAATAATAVTATVELTRGHRRVMAMTRRILATEREASAGEVEARIAIGGMLAQVKLWLAHGEWAAWLEEEVPYSDRTALRYMQLAQWGALHPGLVKRHRGLGVTKLYLLARVDAATLKRVTAQKTHRVPGGPTLTLGQMSSEQLGRLLGVTTKALEEAEAEAKAVRAMQRRVKGIVAAAEGLVEHADAVERVTALAWRDQLVMAARALEETFDLD
jgi:Protein of unknown function (DUF3102)